MLLAGSAWADHWTILAEDAAGLWGQADGTGCGNDLVTAAYAAAGDAVQLKILPYARAKNMVMAGSALACFGMAWAEELRGKVVFPATPLYTNESTLLVRKGTQTVPLSIEALKPGSTVGTVVGYEYPEKFVQLVKKGILIPKEGSSEVQNLKKLAAGRLDYVVAQIDDLKNVEYLLKEAAVADTVAKAFVLEGSGTFVGYSLAYPDAIDALRAFEKGMALIKKNGTYDRILKKWKAKL